MRNSVSEKELFELVKTFQVHQHSKHVGNIEMINVDLTLENFLQIGQL